MPEPPLEISADGTQARPRRTGHDWLDIGVALAALFISLVSLYVAMENQNTQRELLAASSWPFLREVRSNDYSDRLDIALGVSNGGVGPAKIREFQILYDGQPMRSALDLLRRCCGLGPTDADGEDNIVLGVRRDPDALQVHQQLIASLNRISFHACYCSVLDRCWISDLRSTRVTPVHACPEPVVRYAPNGQ
jgi:hypothetical protein